MAGQVVGGNSVLVKALLTAAKASVQLNTSVRRIACPPAACGASCDFTIELNGTSDWTAAEPPRLTSVDQVVIAAPLERTGIQLVPPRGGKGLPPTAALDRGFTEWYVTVVLARWVRVPSSVQLLFA
jgi:hypothetical protein